MLRNIPNKYTQEQLLEDLEKYKRSQRRRGGMFGRTYLWSNARLVARTCAC